MKYTYACKKVSLNDSIKAYTEKKIAKLEKYLHICIEMGRGNRRFFKRFTKFFRRTRQAAAFDKRSRKTAKLSIYKTWKCRRPGIRPLRTS